MVAAALDKTIGRKEAIRLRTLFHSLPIRIRLLIIIIGICFSALLLATVTETIFNWKIAQRASLQRMEVDANMIALQSRATLEFLDPKAAQENLASLRANPQISIACLYSDTGQIFARYVRDSGAEGTPCPPAESAHADINWNTIQSFVPIMRGERSYGTLYMERELDDMQARLAQQLVYKLVIIASVLLLVWPLSFYFQRSISDPICELAMLARIFAHDRTRDIQAMKTSNDELGELMDVFNQMMAEIRQHEQRIARAINELSRSNTELERFAHVCSHDLQEPLRMVSSYAALLEKKLAGSLDEDARQYLTFVLEGASRMRELIQDILTYARISYQTEPMQEVDLNACVAYVLKNLEASVEERRAVIHCVDLPTVCGNKTLLIQIFQNLISNALKFSVHPEVWINAVHRHEAWEFSVKDNGIGIDPKYHARIFEIFRRLNRREQYSGTGVGLAIFKKAVEFHGGHLWVESEAGKGSTFFFTIPD